MDIEFALIADYCELVNGKLYLMGGGWDTYGAPNAPAPVRMAVALGIRVGWDETNNAIAVRMTVEDDDGHEVLRADGEINVGRPTGLVPGSTQLAQMVLNLPLTIPHFGGYRVRILAGAGDDAVGSLLPFRMVQRG